MEVIYTEGGKFAEFMGNRYTKDDKTGYYLASKPSENGHRKRLHVAVWEAHNGPVPKGMHVHHRTGDKSKNEIQDLEIMSEKEHLSWHSTHMSDERKKESRKNLLENAIPAAVEWHKSSDGRAWHSEHARECWEKREQIEYVCTNCGKTFRTKNRYRGNSNMFCSNNCKSAFRRKMGYDNERRTCELCGAEFECNKYSTRKRCFECRHKRN